MKKLSIVLLLSLSPIALIKAMDFPSQESAQKAKQEQQRQIDLQNLLDSQLTQAVKDGDLSMVQSLLARGANPQTRDQSGQELRTIASEMGRDDIFMALKANVPAGQWEGAYLGLVPSDVLSQISRFSTAAQLQDQVATASTDLEKYKLIRDNPEEFALIWSLLGKPTGKISTFLGFVTQQNPFVALEGSIENLRQLRLNLINVLDVNALTVDELKELYKNAIWTSPELTLAVLNKVGNAKNILRLPIRDLLNRSPLETLKNNAQSSPNKWGPVYQRALGLDKE